MLMLYKLTNFSIRDSQIWKTLALSIKLVYNVIFRVIIKQWVTVIVKAR